MQKRITMLSRQEQALKALANDENGAELNVLHMLAAAVLSDEAIDVEFQLVANAIVAQSVLCGRLPAKKKGRPEQQEGVHGWGVANRYFTLRDNGVSYADAVAQVAAEFHKDERHIMRLVKENKSSIGLSLEKRKQNRDWWALCARMSQEVLDAGGEPYGDWMLRTLNESAERNRSRDPIAELDEVIDKALDRIAIADKNIVSFNASD